MHMKRFIWITLVVLAGLRSAATAQTFQINELMQSNIDCVKDDLNQFPDSWVELYNGTSTRIQLSDYRLGINRDGSDHWQLPNQMLYPGQFLLVYCDKEDRGLHAPFRLESGKGCGVYLFRSDGSVIDSVYLEQKQPAPNIAYGRLRESSQQWGYQYTPTPQTANCGALCTQLLDVPTFSEPGRVFTSGGRIDLELSLPEGAPTDTEIRYTLDGSEPTTTSTLYVHSFSIASTRVVRAKCFHSGWLSARSATESYIFLGRDMTLPVISIATKNSYLNDSKEGIYVDGNYSTSKKNYQYDWRRPINFEFFTEAGQSSELNQLCETRVSGAASRGCKLKSLVLYTNKRFGEKHFKYEFFPDQRPGQKKFKSLVLRNAGNDFDYLYMRDALCQRVMASHADLDWQAWRPAIVFINGTYKGILNIRERGNDNNIYTNYDGLEDIDLIENWSSLKVGTIDHWQAFEQFYNEQGHTWEEYSQWMDLDEYINLMIMELYFSNVDFPGNNFVRWRPHTDEGRWRFIAKDVDYTIGLYGSQSSYKTFEWLYNNKFDNNNWANKPEHTLLFRRLMEDEHFKQEFTNRFAIYMGDFLCYDGIWRLWEPMYNQIRTEYPTHRKLYNQWWPNYDSELSTAQSWVRSRTSQVYSQLQSFFNLGAASTLTLNSSQQDDDLQQVLITFNGYPLSEGRFSGKFFAGQEVTLSAQPRLDDEGQSSGRTVTGWRLIRNGQTQELTGNVCHFVMPQSPVSIIAQYGEASLETIHPDADTSPRLYDLTGRPVAHPRAGGLYLKGR